jgi:hypothetical protein
MKRLADDKVISASANNSAVFQAVDILQRSVLYLLLSNDFSEDFAKDNAIMLRALPELYARTSGVAEAPLSFSALIFVLLERLQNELLPLVDEIKESDGGPSVSASVKQSLLSAFYWLKEFAIVEYREFEPPIAEQSLAQGISFPILELFSTSYLRRAPEQSAVIIVLFFVTGLSIFSLKFGVVSGLIGVILCSLLQFDSPLKEYKSISL